MSSSTKASSRRHLAAALLDQQEGVARGQLVELEPLLLLARVLEGPAWIFHHEGFGRLNEDLT
jgi:hypothetical protein